MEDVCDRVSVFYGLVNEVFLLDYIYISRNSRNNIRIIRSPRSSMSVLCKFRTECFSLHRCYWGYLCYWMSVLWSLCPRQTDNGFVSCRLWIKSVWLHRKYGLIIEVMHNRMSCLRRLSTPNTVYIKKFFAAFARVICWWIDNISWCLIKKNIGRNQKAFWRLIATYGGSVYTQLLWHFAECVSGLFGMGRIEKLIGLLWTI